MIKYIERWALKRVGRREDEKLIAMQSMNASLKDGTSTFDLELGGEAPKLLAAVMIGWFKNIKADNYVTLEVTDGDTAEKYALTLQRMRGTSPAKALADLRDEVARLREERNHYREKALLPGSPDHG